MTQQALTPTTGRYRTYAHYTNTLWLKKKNQENYTLWCLAEHYRCLYSTHGDDQRPAEIDPPGGVLGKRIRSAGALS